MHTVQDVADVLLTRRDGRPVYVRDVAEVRLGHKKPVRQVRNFGEAALAVNCVRESGANVIDVMEGLREAVLELNAGPLATREGEPGGRPLPAGSDPGECR